MRISLHLRSSLLALAAFPFLVAQLWAQAPGASRTGPAILSAGPVYDIAEPDFPTPMGTYKVVWEVALGTEDPAQRNPRLESVARFINMHARAGVPRENMKLAVVVHGTAGKDLLDREGYADRMGVDNPNYEMIQELVGFGVQVILCGQTHMARGIPRERLAPGVHVALSAMTALVTLQEQGFRLVPF